MSAHLEITFRTPLAPASQAEQDIGLDASIPVEIIPIEKRNPGKPLRCSSETQRVLVPLRGRRRVEVVVGDFIVRATLPNGAARQRTVRISDFERSGTVNVKFDISDESKNESVAWAYLLGNARKAQLVTTSPVPKFGLYEGTSAELRSGSLRRIDSPLIKVSLGPFMDASIVAEITSHIRFGTRTWLMLETSPTLFVALPPSPESLTSRILITRSASREANWEVHIESGSEAARALAAYFRRGDFPAAELLGNKVLERARDLVRGKFNDLTGALIAGYYIQSIGAWALDAIAGVSRAEWLRWLQNLDTEFPGYSDGAIIRGWACLTMSNPDQAYSCFLHACQRGLPIFTAGLRLLIDGMQYLAATRPRVRSTNEFEIYLGRLRRDASQANWNALTTTLSLPEPEHYPMLGKGVKDLLAPTGKGGDFEELEHSSSVHVIAPPLELEAFAR